MVESGPEGGKVEAGGEESGEEHRGYNRGVKPSIVICVLSRVQISPPSPSAFCMVEGEQMAFPLLLDCRSGYLSALTTETKVESGTSRSKSGTSVHSSSSEDLKEAR